MAVKGRMMVNRKQEAALKLKDNITKEVEAKLNEAFGNVPTTEFDCRQWKNKDPVR